MAVRTRRKDLPAEVVAGKQECSGQTKNKGQESGKGSLVKSKTQRVDSKQQRGEVERFKRSGIQSQPEDAGKGIKEEQTQENGNTQPGQ